METHEKRIYVQDTSGLKYPCNLFITKGRASVCGGALSVSIDGIECYAMLFPTGHPPSNIYPLLGTKVRIQEQGKREMTLCQGLRRIDGASVNTGPWDKVGDRPVDFKPKKPYTIDRFLLPIPDETIAISLEEFFSDEHYIDSPGAERAQSKIAFNVPEYARNIAGRRISITAPQGQPPYKRVTSWLCFHDSKGRNLGEAKRLIYSVGEQFTRNGLSGTLPFNLYWYW